MNQSIQKRVLAGALSLAMLATAMPAAAADALKAWASGPAELTLLQFRDQTAALAKNDSPQTYFDTLTLTVGSACAVTENGKSMSLSAAVQKADNTLLVPADFLAGQIGAQVEQPASDGSTAIAGGGLRVGMQIGSTSIAAQHGELQAPAQVQQQGQTVLVPLDTVAGTLGYEVTETADGAELRNAFQTARLIVKSAGSLTPTGASAVVEGYDDLHILQYDTPAAAYAAYQVYQNADGVEYVEPSVYCRMASDSATAQDSAQDYRALTQKLETATQADDADSAPQHYSWGADTIGVDTFQTVLKEEKTPLPTVKVAVIDSGIDYNHPWFAGRIASGAVNYTNSSDSKGQDDLGHGTHVSGIILDLCCDNVKILPIKVINNMGEGSTESIYCGMKYANEQDVAVVNVSLRQNGYSYLMEEAVQEGTKKGIVYCVGAGNDAANATQRAPAGIPEAITVSAIDSADQLCDFSSFGGCIDFAAPGKNVVSAELDGNVISNSGTSMASPHVAACCALLKSYAPTLTPQQVEEVLRHYAVDLGAPGFDKLYGYGAVNMDFTEVPTWACQAPVLEADETDPAAIRVTLTAQAGASVYYTTDGTVPSPENGQRYTAPLLISRSTRLTAVACMDGKGTSKQVTRVFIIDGQDLPDAWAAVDGVVTQYRGILQDVTVPAEIDGVTITAIGENTFCGNTSVQKINLPESVVTIGDHAFSQCKVLESVDAPGVTAIGASAFADSASLDLANLPALTQVGAYAFSGTGLKTYSCGRLAAIPEGMFRDCANLTSVSGSFVTQIGDYAFAGCKALETLKLSFEKVTSIGKMAFSDAAAAFTANFTSLTTLAPYAFANAAACEITLPERITTIPEGCFLLAKSLQLLSAPGVTRIEAHGLAVGDATTERTLDLRWEKLTGLGEYALEGWKIDGSLTLSSLKTLVPDALCHFGVHQLELPLITTVPTGGLRHTLVEVIVLPRVVSLQAESISGAAVVVVGDGCTDIAEDAISSGGTIVCANEASVPYRFVYESGRAAEPMPYLRKRGNQTLSCAQYAPFSITVLAAGFDLSYQWYRASTAQNSDGEPIDGAVQYKFTPDTTESGTFYYYCVVHEHTNDTTLVSNVYILDIASAEAQPLVSETPVDIDATMQAVTKTMLYVPQADDFCMLEVIAPLKQCPVTTITELETGNTFADGSTFHVTAGRHYLVRVAFNRAGCACRVVLRNLSSGDLPIIMQTAEVPTGVVYSYTGKPIQPALSLHMNGREMQAGIDFDCVYYCNTECGTGYQYCYGKGMYTGAVCVPFTIRDSLTLNTTKDALLRENGSGSYTFVPETTGRYVFSCSPSAEGNYVNSFAEITEADSGEVVSQPVYESNSDFFCVSARLTAGVTYLCTGGLYSGTAQKCSIRLTDQSVTLLMPATTKVETDESLAFTGDPLRPTSLVVSVNDRVLTEGKDYVLLFLNNVHPGQMSIFVCGIGDYCGSLYQNQVRIVIDDFTDVQVDLMPGSSYQACVSPNTPSVFRFTPKETGAYLLKIKQLCGVLTQIYHQEADGTTTLMKANRLGGLDFTAQADETYYLVLFWYEEEASRLPFQLYYNLDCDDTVVTASDCTFTGQKVSPEVNVTYFGRTLRQGIDYTVDLSEILIACGTHSFRILGKGKYEGTVSGEFQIYVPLSEQKETAVLGRNEVFIRKPNEVQSFLFTPQKSREYAILSEEKWPNLLMLTDTAGKPVDLLEPTTGNDDNLLVAFLEAGKTYCITARYTACDRTGCWSFLLRGDCRLLSHVEATYPATMEWTGEALLPPVTLKDGDKVLEQGKDFVYTDTMDTTDCGRGTVYLRGRGKYVGNLSLQFDIVRTPSTQDKAAALTLDVPTTCTNLTHDNTLLYRFTAETADTYHFTMTKGTSVALFDSDKTFVRHLAPIEPIFTEPVIQWSMEAGETVLLQFSRAEQADDPYSSFPICVTQGAVEQIKHFTADQSGGGYAMDFDLATKDAKLIRYEGDYTDVIVVPEQFWSSYGHVTVIGAQAFFSTQNTTQIYLHPYIQRIESNGIACDKLRDIRIPYGCVLMPHSVGYSTSDKPLADFTIYGYLGDFSQTYAAENGFRFVPLDPVAEDWEQLPALDEPEPYTKGDVNNDTQINLTDAILILKDYAQTMLGTSSSLTTQERAAADMNGDGVCDIQDALMVLKLYAQSLLT